MSHAVLDYKLKKIEKKYHTIPTVPQSNVKFVKHTYIANFPGLIETL